MIFFLGGAISGRICQSPALIFDEMPDFMKTKQSRSDITSRYQPVARLDLLCVCQKTRDLVIHQTPTFFRGGGRKGDGGDGHIFQKPPPAPIPSHPGMKDPIRHPRHFDNFVR